MKTKRGLSGIYFRFKNEESGKWENRVFEDLPKENQLDIIKQNGNEWLQQMVITLAQRLYDIGEQFDITIESDEN